MFTPLVIMLQEGAAAAPKNSSMMMILMMVLVFVVMWLFMIRPQQKQQKELNKFRNALEKGQKVVTAGGIHGTVREVKTTTVIVQIGRDVDIEVDKGMIMRAPESAPQK